MTEQPAIQTLYVPLPPDLWAQAVYLTMRPGTVRDQASAMLVRMMAHVLGGLSDDGGYGGHEFEGLPADQEAHVVELVRAILSRSTPSHGRRSPSS